MITILNPTICIHAGKEIGIVEKLCMNESSKGKRLINKSK